MATQESYGEPLAYGVRDTCRIIGIGKTKAFELLAEGTLERVRIGRRTLVTAKSIKALAEGGSA